jgi:hypothetical protein
LIEVAVNVTFVPVQIVVWDAIIEMDGVTDGFMEAKTGDLFDLQLPLIAST